MILAAGLKGIEEGYEFTARAEDDVWSLTESERKAMGMKPLPGSLGQAVDVMASSELVAETQASTCSITCCVTSAPSGRNTGAR